MKNEILLNLHNPLQLEGLYRADKSAFRRAFNALYPEIESDEIASFWNARLNFTKDDFTWGKRGQLVFVIVTAIIAGLLAKLPAILNLDEEFFYSRNIAFLVFPALAAFFAYRNKMPVGKIVAMTAVMVAGVVFINSLPNNNTSDTLFLSCIHMALFLWSVLCFAFVGEAGNNVKRRLGYLSYNGELIILTTLIVIAGGLVSAVTIGLFSMIGFNIEKFYSENIVVFCLPAAPIIASYLAQTNPQLVGKVSPVIAKIFSPVVLVMLLIYLVAIIYAGKDPYSDRQFLLLFNALLVGVMAIIFFSVAGINVERDNRKEIWVLFLLSVVTAVVNSIVLSAILFRIAHWGITPNRAVVLGGNVLILINLLIVTAQLSLVLFKNRDVAGVGRVMSGYLPVYALWAVVVTFVFPFLFGFK